MRKQLLSALLGIVAISASAEVVDWDKIQYWTGEGNNRAALVFQFGVSPAQSPGALVWGYRWNSTETKTGFDLIKDIAAANPDLVVLMQYTGDLGYTLNGAGYYQSAEALLNNLTYDFENAKEDNNISFGFMTPNTGMGQTTAPGESTPQLCQDAIEAAKTSHVIYHPLNKEVFGYPAYDYDYWVLGTSIENMLWQAGWYKGYWMFSIGSADMNDLSYSGLGLSSVVLADGDINAWRYTSFDGSTGASENWEQLNYTHFDTNVGIADNLADSQQQIKYYSLDGTPVANIASAAPGVYIVRCGQKSTKFFKR